MKVHKLAVLAGCSAAALTALKAAPVHAAAGGSDNASDPAYSGGWTNGSNGGTGFNPWAFGTVNPDATGYNSVATDPALGDSTAGGAYSINVGAPAFAITSAVNQYTNFFASRGFSGGSGTSGNSPLAAGQTFTAFMQANYLTPNPGGISVQNSTGVPNADGTTTEAALDGLAGLRIANSTFYFTSTAISGGQLELDTVTNGTGNGTVTGDWSASDYCPDDTFSLSVTPLVDGDLSVELTRSGLLAGSNAPVNATYTDVLSGYGSDAEQFSIYSVGAGAGGDPPEVLYFNNFSVTPAVPEPASLGSMTIGGLLLLNRKRRR